MEKKIHNLEYFSIAEIKTKYRHYINGYLKFDNPKVDLTKYNKAIIFDDILTTRATIDYIIYLCKNLNPDLNLYIYSIIDKE